MTEHSDAPVRAVLPDLLNDAAEDFFPGTAPYDAIVGDARRRVRRRAVGGSALSLVAIGAAVAVGAGSFGGATGHASTQAAPAAAAAGGGVVAPAAAATTPPAVKPDYLGKTVIAQGDFEGTHWTLTRDLTARGFDDVYVTGPNGLRDQAAGGGSTSPGHLADLLNHFGGANADVAASTAVTTLGTGTMDDPGSKDKASPYGIAFLSGIVSSKVVRVQAVFADGTSQDAHLVAAPAGEDGQYYYLPFKSASGHASGHVVYYDGQGHVLQSLISKF